MKIEKMFIQLIGAILLCQPSVAGSVTADDLLITSDIGAYKYYGNGGGQGAGMIAATGHFGDDHQDHSYNAVYFHDANEIGVNLEVTQHIGGDSDKWLFHEVEEGYRDGDDSDNRLGMISGQGVEVRSFNGNPVIYWGLGGGHYSWIGIGEIVVEISYTDLQRTKPEPLEVVQAYLQKFPSTIPASLNFDRAHDEKWIKDEMDRRLWLADRWLFQQENKGLALREALREMADHMVVFLDYREKYYGVSGEDDKEALSTALLETDETTIKNKLAEYKAWWESNKDKPINL